MIRYRSEEDLIAGARNNRDGALIKLFEKYRPLVEKTKNQYYIKDYDDDDLEQEALIVCHEAATKFEPDKGEFCTFYKNQLHHNIISILRHKKALKRKGDDENLSLEYLQESQGSMVEEASGSSEMQFLNTNFCDQYLNDLSNTELLAFQIGLGKYSFEEVSQKYDIEEETLKRAWSRANRKFVTAVYDKT